MFDSLFKKEPAFSIRPRWKEELWYVEGDNSFCFQCGWGVTPGYVYVPPADSWDASVPPFMRGRRDEIIARLRTFENSVIDEMNYPPIGG